MEDEDIPLHLSFLSEKEITFMAKHQGHCLARIRHWGTAVCAPVTLWCIRDVDAVIDFHIFAFFWYM